MGQDAYEPKGENRRALDALLGLSRLEPDGTEALPRHFDEEHMSAFLKGKLNALQLPETQRALAFAKQCHEGQYRKPGRLVPYINHPLTMACHALAMGLEDDSLLAALLLHDAVEECRPRVSLADLPVSAETREIVRLVTKPEQGYSSAEYFAAIAKNPKACLVKCIDRCNNLSTMAIGFPPEKVAEYIEETETC